MALFSEQHYCTYVTTLHRDVWCWYSNVGTGTVATANNIMVVEVIVIPVQVQLFISGYGHSTLIMQCFYDISTGMPKFMITLRFLSSKSLIIYIINIMMQRMSVLIVPIKLMIFFTIMMS